MKKALTLTILTGYILLMGIMGAFASVPDKVDKTKREEIRREIIRNISCPAFLVENNEPADVRAIVEVDQNGKLSVSNIKATSDQLSKYVSSQLKSITVESGTEPDKFILLIHFVVQ